MKKLIFILLCLFFVNSCSVRTPSISKVPSSSVSLSNVASSSVAMLDDLGQLMQELKINPRFAELNRKEIAKTITTEEKQEMQLMVDKRVNQLYQDVWNNFDESEKSNFKIVALNHRYCSGCNAALTIVKSIASELGIKILVLNADKFKNYLIKENPLYNSDANYGDAAFWQSSMFRKLADLENLARKNFLPIFIRHPKLGLHTIGNIRDISNQEESRNEILHKIIGLWKIYR